MFLLRFTHCCVFHICHASLEFSFRANNKPTPLMLSLEFHHPEDLPRPPSLPATVLSRSGCDWTEVSLNVFVAGIFNCQRTMMDLK